MKKPLAIGMIGLVLTAFGCSQLLPQLSSQDPAPVQRNLPGQLRQPATSAPGLQPDIQVPAIVSGILTPDPAAPASGQTSGPAANQEPEFGGASISGPLPGVASATPSAGDAALLPAPTLVMSAASSTLGVGQELEIRVLLSSAPAGVSGYVLDLEITDPRTAEIVSGAFPNFGLATVSDLPASTAHLQAVDLSQVVNATSDEVLLFTTKIRGLAAGTTEVRLLVSRFDDDDGQPVNPTTLPMMLTIQ